MAHVVVLGADFGGAIMAYELRDALGSAHCRATTQRRCHLERRLSRTLRFRGGT